ncbi:MAG: hypothetical protein HZB85_06650 [Deltaproteobacteria bacterium]|nr:hypothetical protein [Deltaproteobacteria bacterium]
MRGAFVTIIAAFCLITGCGGVKPAPEPEYSDVLSRWTRSTKVFDGLDAKIYMSATYKDPSYITSYVSRYSKAYKLDEDYARSLLERELGEADKYNEFFISVYTPEESWNDFDSRDTIWRLYLEDGSGARLVPVSILRVDKGDPLVREFFPYFDMWSSAYRVKFPKYSETGTEPIPNASTGSLRLTVTGIMGAGTLEWRLKE